MLTRRQTCQFLTTAMQDEMTASRLYRRTALRVPDRAIRRILMEMAADEARHARRFAAWRARLCQ